MTEESKPSTQMSPALYDLTSLQREANGRFGFSAKTTLALAQTLYERHKALTYPRTDSRYLPEDYIACLLYTSQRLRLRDLYEAFETGAKYALAVGAAAGTVGIVIGVVTLTGVGFKISYLSLIHI